MNHEVGGQSETAVFKLSVKPSSDQSLHLLTTSIRRMKQWATYSDKLPLLFEVFGMSLSLSVSLCSVNHFTITCITLVTHVGTS